MGAFTRADLLRTSHGLNPITSRSRYGALVSAAEIELNLAALLADVLEPLAAQLGAGRLSSCYRSPAVNAAVGGAPNSAHQVGLAADWIPAVSEAAAINWMASQALPIDRVIREERGASRWLHVQRLPRGVRARDILWFASPRGGVYQACTAAELAAGAE
jgi:zinc D-Ala-D-Ala carboxypeptidase